MEWFSTFCPRYSNRNYSCFRAWSRSNSKARQYKHVSLPLTFVVKQPTEEQKHTGSNLMQNGWSPFDRRGIALCLLAGVGLLCKKAITMDTTGIIQGETALLSSFLETNKRLSCAAPSICLIDGVAWWRVPDLTRGRWNWSWSTLLHSSSLLPDLVRNRAYAAYSPMSRLRTSPSHTQQTEVSIHFVFGKPLAYTQWFCM